MVGRADISEGDAGAVTLAPGDGLAIAIGGSVLERYHVQLGPTELEALEPVEAVAPTEPTAEPPAAEPTAEPPSSAPTLAADLGSPESATAAAAATRAPAGHPPAGIDVTLAAGETAIVHNEIRAPATVRFRLPAGCAASSASLRGLPSNARKGLRADPDADPAALLARLPPGYYAYRLLCDGKPRARGSLTIRGDTGLATLPRRPPRNRLDADGRRYTVLFQNLLPSFSLSWPHAPRATAYVLHIESGGHARTLDARRPALELRSGQVPEGEHTFWWSTAADRRSARTTLIVRFDNAAVAAEIQSPRPRKTGIAAAGPGPTIDVAGTTLPGSRVTVDERNLPIDGQGRFRAEVALPPADLRALAIRIEHRRSGVHYYLRRIAGR
jgi:hypothetical protein